MSHDTAGTDWTALARYLAGESPPEEAEAMRSWLAGDPRRSELFAALDRATRLGPHAGGPVDVEAALRRVKSRFGEAPVGALRPRTFWPTVVLPIAAGLALLVGVALLWQAIRTNPAAPVSHVYATAVGRTDSIPLPDGSRVTLAPASRLTVAAGYGTETRILELQGQALFDVRHDEAKPFTVRAGAAEIQDLGTVFTVRSDAEGVQVVVVSGSVQVQDTAKRAPQPLLLKAGMVGELPRNQQQPMARPTGQTEDDLAWTRGRLVFSNAPLVRVGEELRRWYGLTLVVADSQLRARHLTAQFAGETPQQVLDVIALALGARIERRGDTALVRLRTSKPTAP